MPETQSYQGFPASRVAHPAGFEPTAYRLGGGRSILLSYGNRLVQIIVAHMGRFDKVLPSGKCGIGVRASNIGYTERVENPARSVKGRVEIYRVNTTRP